MFHRFSKISGNQFVLFCLFIILIINLPYFILGQDSFNIFGYDNLDSNVISYKLLAESGKLFAPNTEIIAQPLSGLARVGFPSEFSLITWFYVIFKPHVAYLINIILIQIIAFAGMALLIKKRNKTIKIFIIYAVSLIFSQLNFWPNAGISVAGLPLIFFAYISFKEKPVLSVLLLLLYAIYSNFVLVGIFLIAVFLLDVFIKIFKKEDFIFSLVFVLILLISYLLIEYRLVLSVIHPVFLSHRTEFVSPTFNLKEALSVFFKMIFGEYGHNVKKPELIVFITIIFLSIAKFRRISIGKEIPRIVILILFLSVMSVLMQSTFIYSLTSKVDFLRTIQLQRFYWLLPPLFYILFFLVLEEISSTKKGVILAMFLLTVQFVYVVSANTNWRQIVKTEIFKKEAGKLTYRQFYSEGLYKEIKSFIGKDPSSYRVASIGLQPAAALYSGFYTIDGYFGNYPVGYKKRFLKIMEKELEKNQIARDFFINGGSIVIILSDEEIQKLNKPGFIIPTFLKNEQDKIINQLEINTDAMIDMNCQYLFSAFRIENAGEINMNFEKYFERDDSPYGIFLYSISKKQ